MADWYEVKRLGGGSMKFSAFAKFNRLKVVVAERPHTKWGYRPENRFYAYIYRGEVGDGCMLRSVCGDGPSVDKALTALAEELRSKLLVTNAYSDDRREIQCPAEWLPEEEPVA